MISNKLISLFEHQMRSYEEMGISSTDPILDALDILNRQSGIEVVRLERKGLKATSHVGVIQLGNTTIQILPKIDSQGNAEASLSSIPFEQATKSAVQNLFFMLSYAYDLQLYGVELAAIKDLRCNWFEVLTRLFAEDLHAQIQGGMVHTYQTLEDSLPVLRGRWQIQRQLKHPARWQLFDVIFDEFTPDHPLNRVLRYTVEQLLCNTQDDYNSALLADLQDWLNDVQLLPVISPPLLEQVHFTRLNDRFQPAFNLARLFLAGQSLELSAGAQQAYAFLMDMNRLFERFLTRFLVRHRNQIFPPAWEDVAILPQSEGCNYYLAERLPALTQYIRLRPDILFRRINTTHPILIADIKYKQLVKETDKTMIAEGDLYQMLAYSERFQCPHVLLIYPQWTRRIDETYRLQPRGAHLQAFTVNLRQSLNSSRILIHELREVFAKTANLIEVTHVPL